MNSHGTERWLPFLGRHQASPESASLYDSDTRWPPPCMPSVVFTVVTDTAYSGQKATTANSGMNKYHTQTHTLNRKCAPRMIISKDQSP